MRYCLWPWLSLSRGPPRGLTPFNGAQNETWEKSCAILLVIHKTPNHIPTFSQETFSCLSQTEYRPSVNKIFFIYKRFLSIVYLYDLQMFTFVYYLELAYWIIVILVCFIFIFNGSFLLSINSDHMPNRKTVVFYGLEQFALKWTNQCF